MVTAGRLREFRLSGDKRVSFWRNLASCCKSSCSYMYVVLSRSGCVNSHHVRYILLLVTAPARAARRVLVGGMLVNLLCVMVGGEARCQAYMTHCRHTLLRHSVAAPPFTSAACVQRRFFVDGKTETEKNTNCFSLSSRRQKLKRK